MSTHEASPRDLSVPAATSPAAPNAGVVPWVVCTLLIVLFATAVRAIVTFTWSIPPGIDAAYYPVQARALLEHGRFMYDDLPLIFGLDALLARVMMLGGMEIDRAVLLAARLMDVLLPPWAAAFVMALGFRWSEGRRTAILGSAAAALVVVSWPPVIAMTSDFEKNSLGIVWLAGAVWALDRVLRSGMRRDRWWLGAMMLLAALTHIGAFGVTLALVGGALVLQIALGSASTVWSRASVAKLGAGLIAASLLVVAIFDRGRLLRLVHAPSGSVAGDAVGAVGAVVPAHREVSAAIALVLPLVVFAVYRGWRERREAGTWRVETIIALAAAAVALMLVIPQERETMRRLGFMVPLPASTMLVWWLARRAREERRWWVGGAILTASVVVSFGSVALWPRLVAPSPIDGNGFEELRQMRAHVEDPDRTLVIAPHGVEWWAAYALHTPVRPWSMARESYGSVRASIPADSRERYTHVMVVRPRGARMAELDVRVEERWVGEHLALYEFVRP